LKKEKKREKENVMKTKTVGNWVIATFWLLMALGAQAQIQVDF
jgi:hypothetical protein